MPDPRRLYVLTQLRKRAKISLAEMARACGLSGSRAYESASAWESGKSVPHSRLRYSILDYLAHTLGLHAQPSQLESVWEVLMQEWGWGPLQEADWHALDGADAPRQGVPVASLITPASSSDLAHALALPERIPTSGRLPAPAPLPPGSRMPYTPHPLFVGREHELFALAALLRERLPSLGGPIPQVAVVGSGGIGKTQLAVELVHRFGRFFAGGVFWLSFANPDAVPASVAACGGAAGMGLHPDFDRLSLDAQVQHVLTAWRSPVPRLLVFDNCEDPALVQRWRPSDSGCRVVITSRNLTWAAGLGVATLPLGLLSRADSVRLLRRHCPAPAIHDHDLIALAAELDDLPLALHLAGSYLARAADTLTLQQYLAELRQTVSNATPTLLAHQSLEGRSLAGRPLPAPTGHANHLAQTFALSYAQLDAADSTNRLARDLLLRAAWLAPGEPIPRELLLSTLNGAASPGSGAVPLRRLITVGLLEESGGEQAGLVRMHRLVVAFIRAQDTGDEGRSAVEEALLRHTRALNDAGDQPTLLRLQTHLREVTETALQRGAEAAADLSFELSRHLGEVERYAEAVQYDQRSLAIREEHFGRDDPRIAGNLHYLGELLDWQGDYAGARPHHLRALAIRQQALGPEHPDTATSLNQVGEILHALCDYPDARRHYEQSLRVFEHHFGPDNPSVADVHNNLGLLLNAMGDYAAALPHAKRAVAIWALHASPHGPRQAMALNNLGYVLRAQGRYRDAQQILARALALREAIYGPGNTAVGVTLNHMGRTAYYLGDLDAAQRYLERAIAIFNQALGAEHPITASTLGNLGMLYLDLGDLAPAQPLLEQALSTHQRRCGQDHRHTGRSVNRLGLFFAQAGDKARARASFELALAIRDRILGSSHHDTANTCVHLGTLLLEVGEVGVARPYLERGLRVHLEQLGTAHHYTARSMLAMSRLLQATGDDITARARYGQAMSIYRQTLGDHHPFTVKVYESGTSKG